MRPDLLGDMYPDSISRKPYQIGNHVCTYIVVVGIDWFYSFQSRLYFRQPSMGK